VKQENFEIKKDYQTIVSNKILKMAIIRGKVSKCFSDRANKKTSIRQFVFSAVRSYYFETYECHAAEGLF
jgi:hypothetical protein